ncbi:MAG: hypothetical protein Q9195_001233 [Heterodermia aff. obscurata]
MQILSALAKILPLAPFLSSRARTLLRLHSAEIVQAFRLERTTGLCNDPDRLLHLDLLTVFRLLVFDNEEFAAVVALTQMQILLNHSHRPTRYLAIRILCMYLHASDNFLSQMIKDYIEDDTSIEASWESIEIDYYFLGLWEEQRLANLRRELTEARAARSGSLHSPKAIDILQSKYLSPNTARICGVLLPRLEGPAPPPSSLVLTRIVEHNMYMLAKAVRDSNNVLVTGLAGAGKSSLIRHVADELCRSSSPITIILNEQTDIKLLLGVYTSEKSPGSFNWRPGILTQAVIEGRWVIVEDIDRAPSEITSTLLPLLERGELFVQNRNESIKAAPGFKLIATIRSFVNTKGEIVNAGFASIGSRHWTTVPITSPGDTEFEEMIIHRYGILRPYIQKIMGVHKSLQSLSRTQGLGAASMQSMNRSCGLRELLRWCKRLDELLKAAGVVSGNEPISESTNDSIFLEAVDCFAGHIASEAHKVSRVMAIAEELQFPAERVRYCLEVRKPEFSIDRALLRIGRAVLTPGMSPKSSQVPLGNRPFAMTNDVLRTLESVGMALQAKEPCLLVGETGTGKTALIQHLAKLMNTKLIVVNLSQQSEAGDLLGGYKPVSLRSLALAMMKHFIELFNSTFSTERNQRYVDNITKTVEKGRWQRLLAFWREALQMVQSTLSSRTASLETSDQKPRAKRRKMEPSKYQALKSGWAEFESEVQVFQMHLDSGSKAFAFSFIEGNIVKAVRNGDWVLLDEINLASSDTLESLIDLLSEESEGGPSLLLSESGHSERIRAHKNFRLFGAMNPATDIGKREMPAGLRSRFTEIFVSSPDRNIESLVLIVKEYLGSLSNVDVRAAADIANLYLEIKRLGEQNAVVDGSGQKPHFSLRTLTRTLVYVRDIAHIYGLRRSLFEGFSMSFLTLLNAESGLQALSLIQKYIIGPHKNGPAYMKQVVKPPEDGRQYIQFKQYWIAQGGHPIHEQPHYILTPFVERNLLNLVRATSTRRFPILLQGPTSSGKTSMIEYLANISGNKFLRVNNHEHTDIQEYLGSYTSSADGKLQYQDGVLVRALREGSWIVLDELNLAPTDVLEALNRLLDDNKELFVPETQEIIRPHGNFMLFATQNPPGIYGGRKVLSRAFRNRFVELHFDDIPEEELEVILRERCQIAPSFCTRIVAVYKELSVIRQKGRLFEEKNSFATLRDLFRWALRDADDREQLAVNGFLLLAERVRDVDERSTVKRVIEGVMKVKIDEKKIYDVRKAPERPAHRTITKLDTVWTDSMVRLYILVSEALKHDEPVLLVGDTGSGKTTICQVIATHMGKQLHILNAHQNMDTSDLIGSQRPVRNKAHLELQLAQDLARVLKVPLRDGSRLCDLPSLLSEYDAVQNDKSGSETSLETRLSIEANRLRCAALFEWADGSIVQAMKTGQHFLFDEISLADDSVLERLNSVLEPNRKLFLAEKATDSDPVAAFDGFQMYATMNPGGDYGKKELSPALRNRFTEIWVPPIQDVQELLRIARVKLADPYTYLAAPIVAFATWYSARYNPMAPSISIRDLLAWIRFVNRFGLVNTHSAVCQGAAMVYMDGLGADPAAKTSIWKESVHNEREACLSRLSELFQYDMESIYRQELRLSMSEETFKAGLYQLDIHGKVTVDSSYSLEAPTTKDNVTKIVRALQITKSILLEGSPGVGKTTLISAIAKAIGIPLTRINLSDQTDLADLFGSDVPLEGSEAGRFGWHQAPFLKAMQNGEWVLLDEMNLASQSVLEGLNACLDHRGQIYVSELDQTFFRHDDFVLFAAQNPRKQGGGRKGLPASFVDRFTVVYIEDFRPDDLLIICSQAFQNCASQLITQVVESIITVSAYLQDNPKFGLHGGPWQFNLRDAFRWLQLLTKNDNGVSAKSVTDYLPLVFLQRFRTSEDRAFVSSLLEKSFPSRRQYHNLFVNLSKSYLQVGLGILPRKSNLGGVYAEDSFTSEIDLFVTESIMFCVQMRWPCLLVGPSGSGKSHTISQLARIVGTDVITIALNAETDINDLVGGFEQVDPQRRLTKIIRKLKRLIRQTMAGNLGSKKCLFDCVDVLEGYLQQHAPDLVQVTASLRQCAQALPHVDFSSFAEELEAEIQHAHEDRRAHFEWVDGVLINALKDGAWLVLDNANLCNPSILDRLNSLLEPNGFLSVNEHRAADGTTRIIEPHENFRLFLTMDPCYGELSQAMRNRSVELFLLAAPESQRSSLMLEASLARYATFNRFDWKSLGMDQLLELSSVCFDHLAFSDFPVNARWWEQVGKGLFHIPPIQRGYMIPIMRAYNTMLGENAASLLAMKADYRRIFNAAGLEMYPSDLWTAQTIHPLNNPLYDSIASQDRHSSDLLLLGFTFDFVCKLYFFTERIQQLKETANTRLTSSMSRLELSFSPGWIARNETTMPVGVFLDKIIQTLHQVLAQQGHGLIDRIMLQDLENVLFYAGDLADIIDCPPFDEGAFQTFQMIGQSMVDELRDRPNGEGLATSFSAALGLFGDAWRLTSGLSMEIIWEQFRPPSVESPSLLELRCGTKALSDSFDALSWTFGASIQELSALRNSIVQVFDMLDFEDVKSGERLKDAQNALEELERGKKSSQRIEAKPFFRIEFEDLLQYSYLSTTSSAMTQFPSNAMLSLLACQPTMNSMWTPTANNARRLFYLLDNSTGIARSKHCLMAVRDTLAVSMLQRIDNMSEVPLRSLALLRTELKSLANLTATMTSLFKENHLQNLSNILIQIHSEIVHMHEKYLEAKSLASYRAYVNDFVNKAPNHDLQSAPELQMNAGPHKFEYFRQILENYLKPSLTMLHSASKYRAAGQSHEERAAIARAYILFFTGCLILYIPDRTLDPAWKSLAEQYRYRKRKTELEVKLWALTEFEQVFTGQPASFRSQIVQSKLNTLGNRIPTRPVSRPQVSVLGDLQAVFNGLLDSVVRNSPTQDALQGLFHGDEKQKSNIDQLRTKVARFTVRLRDGFRSYEDITGPLVSLLQGLDVGLALALIACESRNAMDTRILSICRSTPFIGMKPDFFEATTEGDLKAIISHTDVRLVYLTTAAFFPALKYESMRPAIQTMLEVFQRFYEEWKEQLSDDQKEQSLRSSLYRYRGSEEEQSEETAHEVEDIFPDDGKENDTGGGVITSMTDSRILARNLAVCHRHIFDMRSSPQQVVGTLRYVANTLGRLQNEFLTCAVPVDDFLPALIVQLDDKCGILQGTLTASESCNFYEDPNVPEVHKLTNLIHRIQERYTGLREFWPEHATLQEVLNVSSQILDMRHTEPIAKFLTKSEQLHHFIHEWEIIASKEFSTATLYQQLTALLVDWRRLELSSWARLLADEDSKCSEDVDAWWFIAYETIVAVPLSVVHADDVVREHSEQLIATLTEFMLTTSMGHYVRRLQLIESFKSHVQLLAQELPSMKIIENALINFLKFYKRFNQHIQKILQEGRQSLERNMKEVLLLASWKDTNINALRESAKRSHGKLFKIIRRYRELLAQPVRQLLLQTLPVVGEHTILQAPPSSNVETQDLGPAIQLCQECLPQWATRSPRLKNPIATTGQMARIGQVLHPAVNLADDLNHYASDLLENIKELQKETPATKNTSNEEFTRHLKTRKRKLFTDTLKNMRQMGFKANLSASALAKQSTIPKVLSDSPAFGDTSLNINLNMADSYWHSMLDNLSSIRENSQRRSEDISHAEASRVQGYLEDMLSTIIKERVTLSSISQEIHHLDRVIESWKALSNLASPPFRVDNPGRELLLKKVFERINLLPLLLGSGCILLEKHGRLGGIDNSTIIQRLRVWEEKTSNLAKSHKSLSELPSGLHSLLHEQAYRQGEESLRALDANLQEWAHELPGVGFILRQLKQWTEIGTIESPAEIEGTKSIPLIDFDHDLNIACDSILVAVQRMQTVLSAMPANYEENAWLTRILKTSSNGLRNLQISEVTLILENIIEQLPHVVCSDRESIKIASAACSMLLPIIQQFRHIANQALFHCSANHRALCKLASILAQSAFRVISQGYCDPTGSSKGETAEKEKLEEGVGLGEGEGAKNISKDVQDDEDLSELAQEKGKKEEGSPESVEEAVDMNHDELVGDLEDASGNQTDEGAESGEDEEDIDEEVGKVDDLNPGAIDEKMWDGGAELPKEEKEGDKGGKKSGEDEQKAEEGEELDEIAREEADGSENEETKEDENVVPGEAPKLDSYVPEEQNLNLPEDMDLDNDGRSSLSDLQGSDFDEASNIEEEEIDEHHSATEGAESDEGDKLEDRLDNTSDVEQLPDLEKGANEDDPVKEDGVSPIATDFSDLSTQDQGFLPNQTEDSIVDPYSEASKDFQGQGQGVEQEDEEEQHGHNSTESERHGQAKTSYQDDAQAVAEEGSYAKAEQENHTTSKDEMTQDETTGNQAFRKLGDALEKWHRQQQEIRDAAEDRNEALQESRDTAMTGTNFEHLHDEEAQADAQALGAASNEQVQTLDQRAFDTEVQDQTDNIVPDQDEKDLLEDQDVEMDDEELLLSAPIDKDRPTKLSTFVGKHDRRREETADSPDVDASDEDIPNPEIHPKNPPALSTTISTRPPSEARRLWSHYETLTHPLSLILTEQLRLILAPTLATKMRGDFRTGKRLNLKRIIPYIASNYKRDKIWMRRSVPQKRSYQVMLAVDDSKSMGASGSGHLAFEALVLVAKSLSMLEVGDIAVVGFGEDVKVAHEFDQPFSAEAGVRILQQFGFSQRRTDVRKLVAEATGLFRDARVNNKAPMSSAAGTELWQLLLIISDGICEDHDTIRRLVRRAREERIMVVFVIVDAVRGEESIVDMSQAVFEPDPSGGGDGAQKLKIKRYLDDFPFTYYLVVEDVKELPGVLATALRGWFSEIVGEAG